MTEFNLIQADLLSTKMVERLEFEAIEIPFNQIINAEAQFITMIKSMVAGTDNTIWLDKAQDNFNKKLESWKLKNKE